MGTSNNAGYGALGLDPDDARKIAGMQAQAYNQAMLQAQSGLLGQSSTANTYQPQSLQPSMWTGLSGTLPSTIYPNPPPYPEGYGQLDEEKIRSIVQEEVKKQILDYIDRFSEDGITIPVEALRKELNGQAKE